MAQLLIQFTGYADLFEFQAVLLSTDYSTIKVDGPS